LALKQNGRQHIFYPNVKVEDCCKKESMKLSSIVSSFINFKQGLVICDGTEKLLAFKAVIDLNVLKFYFA